MEWNIDKLRMSKNAVGHDKVFLYFPKYIDGYLVWWQYAWKRYKIEWNGNALFERYMKHTIGYMRFQPEKKKIE
jgi:hypothetical protein